MSRIILLLSLSFVTWSMATAQSSISNKQNFHDFDFWLGEWTVYKYGTDTITGHSRITSIADSLAIQEFYKTPNGAYHGTSLNKYNQSNGKWEQFWVDNSGITLFIRGGLDDGKMVMQDAEPAQGQPLNRITWVSEPTGSVRQTWDQSTDKGITWITVFDGKYVKKEK